MGAAAVVSITAICYTVLVVFSRAVVSSIAGARIDAISAGCTSRVCSAPAVVGIAAVCHTVLVVVSWTVVSSVALTDILTVAVG